MGKKNKKTYGGGEGTRKERTTHTIVGSEGERAFSRTPVYAKNLLLTLLVRWRPYLGPTTLQHFGRLSRGSRQTRLFFGPAFTAVNPRLNSSPTNLTSDPTLRLY